MYASEAVARHGAARGAWLSLKRLSRCHPWNPGGFDPVPDPGRENGNAAQPVTIPTRNAGSAASE